MRKKILVIFLAMLVLVLAFTACAQEPSAQEIVDSVIESGDNIKTYQFDLEMTMDMTGEAAGEAVAQTVKVSTRGKLDLDNFRMSADLTLNADVAAPAEEEIEMGVEMYIIDSQMYTRPESPGQEPVWIKEAVSAERWEMMKGLIGLESYQDLLETAEVELTGSEKVEGVDCYVLQLTPDMAQLWQIGSEPQGGIGTGGFLPPVPEEYLEEAFRSFSVKQWISKDTYFLVKVEIDMAMETTPEIKDYLGDEADMSIDIALSFLAQNYNQPVDIVVPPEALEATQ